MSRKKGRPIGSILSNIQKLERLRILYVAHCRKFGKISDERYQDVLDGIDLCMEVADNIKLFEEDLHGKS